MHRAKPGSDTKETINVDTTNTLDRRPRHVRVVHGNIQVACRDRGTLAGLSGAPDAIGLSNANRALKWHRGACD